MLGSQAGNGVPKVDGFQQMGIQLPWRELVLCSLALSSRPASKAPRKEPWEEGPSQNVCLSKTAHSRPSERPGVRSSVPQKASGR